VWLLFYFGAPSILSK
jgi:hypothetical protein